MSRRNLRNPFPLQRTSHTNLIYSIGFGNYDWTQYKAIGILCRLAQEGIQTKKIVKDIGDNILDFRYEAMFPSLASLSRITNNEEVPKIILSVFDEYSSSDPIDGLAILKILAVHYPNQARSTCAFIKSVANGEGLENRSPFRDGAVLTIDTNGEKRYSLHGRTIQGSLEETHRINAAALYYYLDDSDKEIQHLIDFWEQNAKDETQRNMITKLKSKKNQTQSG